MCKSLNIISRSKNGTVTFCNHSKLFQLIFNNLCFELYEWELEALKSYIEELDLAYWENQLKHWSQQRKIPISVGKKHFIILVNREEISELLSLLQLHQPKIEFLKYKDIDYQFIEN
ncbi:DUF6686 family protein [Flagellimonas zhangzhouensis]|uniref:Uncharacterized protein n=1 Tax=Flagellimonas zhangzhouensis TaxID=1073328 RepID=A0A1H2QX48_9FLAO|nr:DUF6686 family protein [Allomuricauda zhangzhouensis]SDQ57378.1 hypothetical protein SAMN05216294_1738 [Allomuricauda zhangzhouensis]SDW11450.1 hypothetical protein SAMN04487892_0390 [Allomuricauda zhangzhouensis]